MDQTTLTTCSHCNGTGKKVDHRALGMSMRHTRVMCGLKIYQVAKSIGVSIPYVSDLELGKRNWNAKSTEKYKTRCDNY